MNEWRSEKTVAEYLAKTTDPETAWYEHEVNLPDLKQLIPEEVTSLLDFGCGTGKFTKQFSGEIDKVVGAEMEPMLSTARKTYPEVTFVNWEAGDPAPKGIEKFDAIFAKLVLQFIENLEETVNNFKDVLHTDGVMIVSIPHPERIADKFNLQPDTSSRYDDEIGDTGIKINPIYRPKEDWIKIFTEAGFKLLEVSEPLVPEEILQKHNLLPNYENVPKRLNLKFVLK